MEPCLNFEGTQAKNGFYREYQSRGFNTPLPFPVGSIHHHLSGSPYYQHCPKDLMKPLPILTSPLSVLRDPLYRHLFCGLHGIGIPPSTPQEACSPNHCTMYRMQIYIMDFIVFILQQHSVQYDSKSQNKAGSIRSEETECYRKVMPTFLHLSL